MSETDLNQARQSETWMSAERSTLCLVSTRQRLGNNGSNDITLNVQII